ncbi:MAG: sodium ion-translocating decarboxylase subunit beta [Clostridia bacterium]|nr:sodium ion-translocating decarboxylase subunit beta [Clostridia bacterium]MBO7250072.1 sodium ion-translocating decarboxylase subunit beta [Clostridia bacterium]
MLDAIKEFLSTTGVARLISDPNWWQAAIMFLVAFVLVYLAIVKKFEPLLLLPIAIGMLLTNLPGAGLFHLEFFIGQDVNFGQVLHDGGLLDLLYLGVKLGIYPSLIFMGIGAMTDFSPLISNPKSLLIGAGAQLGVFVAFSAALLSGMFSPEEAAAIGIIGGADGPTAILVTKTLAPPLLGAIAIAAYSYMALIPMIQPPFMKLLTTKKERQIRMTALRQVTKTEKILFPIVVTFVVGLIVPDAVPLVGCLMFGNLLNVCGVTDRLSKTAQNELMNIVTIFLGITVGATASAENFLRPQTLLIIACGLIAFCISTCGGLITAKIMNWISGGTINPLIGSAGVSAVPMAARVSQKVGQSEDPSNFLLMHAMGPNVAGVIGSAVAAGVFLSWFN